MRQMSDYRRSDLKRETVEKFKAIFDSDEQLLSSMEFPEYFTESLVKQMIFHDQKKIEKTYINAGLVRAMTYLHLPPEERVEAGFHYADALFAKDKVEERYRNDQNRLITEEMFRGDGFETDNIFLNTAIKKVRFDKESLGDWSTVYEYFRNETELTVEKLFPERPEEMADASALFKTVAWRKHKVGQHIAEDTDGEKSSLTPGYLEEFAAALEINMASALQKFNYPEKDSHGWTGPGPLPTMYLTLVEHHDQRNVEEAKKDAKLFAKRLNRQRRNRKQDLRLEYR